MTRSSDSYQVRHKHHSEALGDLLDVFKQSLDEARLQDIEYYHE